MFSNSNAVVNGGTFKLKNQTVHLHGSRGIDRLEAATAPAAFHNSRERFDPPKCHPRTREAVLRKILDWIHRKLDTHAFVMWLYGAAGAGKSAIAQTIAEICHKEDLLLASFFFSRSDSFRNTTERLVATLAYQIVVTIPSVRGLVETAVENDPLIFSRSLDAQFDTLIVRPLEQIRETGISEQISPPALIILDGLDECMDGTRTNLLNVISAVAQSHGLVFLIFSRAEQDISMAIRFGSTEKYLTQIALDNDHQSHDDIIHFFRDKFEEIKRTHILRAHISSSWPDAAVIRTLVAKASGQFIYASTVLKYVSSPRHRPTSRLDVILGISPPINKNDTPFAQLDALYMHIISSSEDPAWTVRIISACLLLAPSSHNMWIIEDFLGLSPGDGGLFFSDLASVIEYTDVTEMRHFRVLHASLGDFLFDISRSRQFHADPQTMHNEISRWCLGKIMNGEDIVCDTLISRDNEMWERAAIHCPLAQMTPQLMDDMRSASLRDKLEASLSYPYTSSVFFIHCIKKLKSEEAQPLYAEYLSLYDQKFISFLDKKSLICLDVINLRDPQLLGLVGPQGYYDNIPTIESIIWRAFSHIFNVPYKEELDRSDNRNFIFNLPHREVYIYDFFGDAARSGRHAIGDGHYTKSAEKCSEYLLNPHHIPIQGVRSWARRSRKSPWLWRRRHPSVVTSICEHWKYRFWRIYVKPYRYEDGSWSWSTSKLPLEPLLVVHMVLTILPPLLANITQGSADLDALCESLISGRLPYFVFPYESDVVKEEIEAYLSRREVDTSE